MKRIITSFQRVSGLTSSEALVVLTIASVLVIGWIGQSLNPDTPTHEIATIQRIASILDSLEDKDGAVIPSATRNESYVIPSATRNESHVIPNAVRDVVRRVNINTASRTQLMQLPGVGPATADKIIEARSKAKFASIEGLLNVKGIGAKKLEKMRAYVVAP